jgi:hypothetical protein
MQSLYLLLLAILLAVYGCTLIRVSRDRSALTPLLGWLIGLGFFLIVPLAILTLHGGYELPSSEGVSEAWTKVNLANPLFFRPYLLIWLSLILACLPAWASGGARSAAPNPEASLSIRKLEHVILITMTISLIDWALLIWLVGGLDEFLVSHWYFRGELLAERLGFTYTLYTRLSLANQLLFTGAAALHSGIGLRWGKMSWGFTALLVLFLLLEMVMSGNRIFIAFYLLALVASSAIYGQKSLIAVLLAASPLLILLFSVWGAVRHDISKLSDEQTSDVLAMEASERTFSSLMHATEGGSVLLLMHIVNDFGGRFDYLYGSTYARVFTFWLPRSLYPNRPLDFTNQAAIFYLPGETTSLCSTALGEACANFGPLSILAMPLFTALVVGYSNCLARARNGRPLLSAVSFVVLIWFARCTFAENVINLLIVALLIRMLKLEKGLCAENLISRPEAEGFPISPSADSSLGEERTC